MPILGQIKDFERDMNSRWAMIQAEVIPHLNPKNIKEHDHKGKDVDCEICYMKSLGLGLFWIKSRKSFSSSVIYAPTISADDFKKNLQGSVNLSCEQFLQLPLNRRLTLSCDSVISQVTYSDSLQSLRFGPIKTTLKFMGVEHYGYGIDITVGKLLA